MLLSFYRLNDQPFGMAPDPKYLYRSRSYRAALASLGDGVRSGCGFMSLVAPHGAGKTTLLSRLLADIRGSGRTVHHFHAHADSPDFIQFVAPGADLNPDEQDSVIHYRNLYDILTAEVRAGRCPVLVIDEAQDVSDSVLETVRLLSDFEIPSRKLMQVIMVGQPGLATKLAGFELPRLLQKTSIMVRLEPLSLSDVADYIEHRCSIAGFEQADLYSSETDINGWSYFSRERAPLFTTEALVLVAAASHGIPAEINSLCFRALSLGFSLCKRTISSVIVREVISNPDLLESDSFQAILRDRMEPRLSLAGWGRAQGSLDPPLLGMVSDPAGEEGGYRRSFNAMIRWVINRHHAGTVRSLVFLLVAGSMAISLMSRRSVDVSESHTLAASRPNVVEAATMPPLRNKLTVANPGPNGSSPRDLVTVITAFAGEGEDLDSLGMRYLGRRLDRQTRDEILRLNPHLGNPDRIEGGERIRIPVLEPAAASLPKQAAIRE